MLKLLSALCFGTALLLGIASPPSPSYAQVLAQADDDMSEAEGMMDEAPADEGMMEEAPAEDEMMDEAPAEEDPMVESEMGDDEASE